MFVNFLSDFLVTVLEDRLKIFYKINFLGMQWASEIVLSVVSVKWCHELLTVNWFGLLPLSYLSGGLGCLRLVLNN